MILNTKTKENILAIITVFLLFILVGGLFFAISLNNKRKTDELKATVLRIKKENEIIQKLANLSLATSTLNTLTSKAYSVLVIASNGSEKVLAEKNSNLVLPIASITKLMTAIIVLDNLDLESEILATAPYVGQEESYFVLEIGKKYKVKELLANTLIASDNDSARLLASALGMENFIAKMNYEAQALDLLQTRFFNVTGLDSPVPSGQINISTVNDLLKLIIYIRDNYPQILKLTSKNIYDFCTVDNICKIIQNTNKLLERSDFKHKIIGGKTGYTDMALKNLILMANYDPDLIIVSVVLNSENNFGDTLELFTNLNN